MILTFRHWALGWVGGGLYQINLSHPSHLIYRAAVGVGCQGKGRGLNRHQNRFLLFLATQWGGLVGWWWPKFKQMIGSHLVCGGFCGLFLFLVFWVFERACFCLCSPLCLENGNISLKVWAALTRTALNKWIWGLSEMETYLRVYRRHNPSCL